MKVSAGKVNVQLVFLGRKNVGLINTSAKRKSRLYSNAKRREIRGGKRALDRNRITSLKEDFLAKYRRNIPLKRWETKILYRTLRPHFEFCVEDIGKNV